MFTVMCYGRVNGVVVVLWTGLGFIHKSQLVYARLGEGGCMGQINSLHRGVQFVCGVCVCVCVCMCVDIYIHTHTHTHTYITHTYNCFRTE